MRIIVEVADENGKNLPPGKTGRIVVTCLDNTFMPLIRYEIGDRGAFFSGKECSCPNQSPLLKISERTSDLLEMRDGSKRSPKLIFKFIAEEPLSHIKRVQVRQEKPDEVSVLMETSVPIAESILLGLAAKIEVAYGKSFSVKIQALEHISQDGPKFLQFMPLSRFSK